MQARVSIKMVKIRTILSKMERPEMIKTAKRTLKRIKMEADKVKVVTVETTPMMIRTLKAYKMNKMTKSLASKSRRKGKKAHIKRRDLGSSRMTKKWRKNEMKMVKLLPKMEIMK